MNMLDPFMPPLALANIMEIKLRASRQAPTLTMPAVTDDDIAARVVAVPPGAANGDDDLMSHPSLPVMPAPSESEDAAALWLPQIDAAKATWDKLSEAELLRTQGVEHKLINLVQQRYSTTRVRATRQVKAFFQEQIS